MYIGYYHTDIMKMFCNFILVLVLISVSNSLKISTNYCKKINKNVRKNNLNMVYDVNMIHDLSHSMQYAAQGLADAIAITTDVPSKACADFGQPGWAPFCFLNGNPVFTAFDEFQAFIQNSVVVLHDFLLTLGIKNAYGPSIVLFTIIIRLLLFPVTYQQLASSQKSLALSPKIAEIKEKYPNKELQNQVIALLYQESNVNPLAGCLPALVQIPVFIALYRSFFNLSTSKKLGESFLWLPNLEGPVYGERSSNWIFNDWHDFTPSLGWPDTLAFLSVPILLVIAQTISLRLLTTPSEDPTVQRSQVSNEK